MQIKLEGKKRIKTIHTTQFPQYCTLTFASHSIFILAFPGDRVKASDAYRETAREKGVKQKKKEKPSELQSDFSKVAKQNNLLERWKLNCRH